MAVDNNIVARCTLRCPRCRTPASVDMALSTTVPTVAAWFVTERRWEVWCRCPAIRMAVPPTVRAAMATKPKPAPKPVASGDDRRFAGRSLEDIGESYSKELDQQRRRSGAAIVDVIATHTAGSVSAPCEGYLSYYAHNYDKSRHTVVDAFSLIESALGRHPAPGSVVRLTAAVDVTSEMPPAPDGCRNPWPAHRCPKAPR